MPGQSQVILHADPGGSFRLNPHSFRKTLALLESPIATDGVKNSPCSAKAACKSADKTGKFLVTNTADVGKAARRGQKNDTSYSTGRATGVAAFQAIRRRGCARTSGFAAGWLYFAEPLVISA
jgi:hypothetical protein